MVRYPCLEAPMRTRFIGLSKLVGCLFFLAATLTSVSCKSPLDVPAIGYVTVDFSTGEVASRATGVLPADITSIVISVKADDMDVITKTLTAPALTATLDVPAGAARQFEVVAKDAAGFPVYQGKETLTIEAGTEQALSVIMLTMYKLLYDPNGATGGDVPGTLYRAATDVVTVAPNSGLLIKTGFTFSGWYTLAGGVNTPYAAGANLTMPAGDVVLFAKWITIPTYTVTFDSQGGTGVLPATGILSATALVSLPTAPTNGSQVFSGWFTAISGGGTPFTTSTLVVADVTVYAYWTAAPSYNVIFNATDPGVTGSMVNQAISSGASATLSTNGYNRPGYTFEGWATTFDGSVIYAPGASYTMGGADINLYAVWTAMTNIVLFNAQMGTTPVPIDIIVTTDQMYGPLASTNRVGYSFGGWWTGVNGTGAQIFDTTTVALTATQTLYANWTINQYTVNYDANGATFGSVPGPQTADYNTSIIVSDNIGSLIGPIIQDGIRRRFIGWDTVAGSGVATYVAGNPLLLGAADVWLYAQYQTTPAIIGQIGPADGFVFYDQLSIINGWRYLEASPVDQAALGVQAWSNITATLGTTLPDVGEGLANTAAIVAQVGHTSSAALICDTYTYGAFADWYLPSLNELSEMYTKLQLAVPLPLGNLSSEYYWSSTEGATATFANRFHFGAGSQTEVDKTTLNPLVRAVRRF